MKDVKRVRFPDEVSGLRRRAEVLSISLENRTVELNGQAVELEYRDPTWRILGKLAGERLAKPGSCVSTAELIRVGWPKERVRWISGRNRVYVVMSALRKAGLRRVIDKRKRGYRISPECVVRVEDEVSLWTDAD
jgi:hypothetical protein